MKTYEGVYFLSAKLKDDEALEQAAAAVKADIEKLGGTVRNQKKPERKTFARPQQKQQGGYYMEVLFDLDPANVVELRKRHKLDNNVFRVMVVDATKGSIEAASKVDESEPAAAAKPAAVSPHPRQCL